MSEKPVKRILVLHYSQSGEVDRAVQSFVGPLSMLGVELVMERIKPKADYAYPWKSVYGFFDVFPECLNEEPPEIHPPSFGKDEVFDLVILAYQVWFLAPSLPVQGFLKSEYARILKDTKIITLVISRGLWFSASETMKRMIADLGGIHIDNVAVSHQGPTLTTFVTTPRWMLTGRRDRFLRVFPEAGTGRADMEGLERFGRAIANNLGALSTNSQRSLLKGLDAVELNARYVILERAGWISYRYWAKIARLFGEAGSWKRRPIIYLFLAYLIVFLPVAIPISMILRLLLNPLLNTNVEAYVHRLKSPSGVA
jgi:hypothetical protein